MSDIDLVDNYIRLVEAVEHQRKELYYWRAVAAYSAFISLITFVLIIIGGN
jgi:hypothetical protein